ncbi:MAG: hypothetical protein RLZZ387_2132 [Chloroflexota bacterium]
MAEAGRAVRAAEIFEALKRRILRWEYPPGQRLGEEELCREFGVSRSPVREALRMLEESGLVDRAPYRGCSVKQPNLQEINELYDVRVILESAVAELLASRALASPELERLAGVWAALARVQSYAEVDGAELAEQDRAFHESLAAATGNRTLCEMLRAVNDRLHFMRMTDITSVDRLWQTCRQHLEILERIAAGDVPGAREALRANITGAREHVESAVKEVLVRAYMSGGER